MDFLNLQPSVIDKSLSGKTVLLAGQPKIGKSEFCAQSPDTLILDLENGYNAHPGVYKQPVLKWSDMKLALRELRKPEVQAKFKNVVIDTINEAWDLCTSYICSQEGVQKIKDIPYGQGYKARDDEFANVLREIINLNYGLILTCHTKEKSLGTVDDVEISQLLPDVDKRCLPIINGLVDIIGVIVQEWTPEGESKRWLITKATPRVVAGSRWPNLAPRIPFGYKNLEDAIITAIEEAEKNGAKVVDKIEAGPVEVLDYDTIRNEARQLWQKLVLSNPDEPNEEMAQRILKKIEIIFGKPVKLSEITEDQVDLFNLAVIEMRDMLNK